MNPGAVGAEQKLACSGAFDGFDDVIETADGGSVGINVRVARNLIDHLLMSPPIVGVAAEVRDDEIYVRVLRRQHVDDFGATDHVKEDRKAEGSRGFAHFAGGHGFKAVNLDAAKAPLADG